jgi:GT2 family glycosyltransferase
MKIQLEQLDLLAPWPAMALRDGYYAVRVLVRAGVMPLGDVFLRPVRSRVITHDRLRRRIARRCAERIADAFMCAKIDDVDAILDPAGAPEEARKTFAKLHIETPANSLLPPSITVAIMTRGRDDLLAACIWNLRQLDYRGSFDILVVDSGNDPVPARDVAEKLSVGYVRCLTVAPGRARNAAIERAHGEWVAFVDDDCRPEREWLTELARPAMQHASARCICGMLQPARLESSADVAFEMHRGLAHRFDEITLRPDFLTASRRRAAPMCRLGSASNLLVHRQFAQLVGGFDPHMLHAEEADLCYRALLDDYTVHYTPRASAHHHRTWTRKTLRKHIREVAAAIAGYHVQRVMRYNDIRSLLELTWQRPRMLTRELFRAMKGKSKYPWSLLLVELRATLGGPMTYAIASLRRRWRSNRAASFQRMRHLAERKKLIPTAAAVAPSPNTRGVPPRNPTHRAA